MENTKVKASDVFKNNLSAVQETMNTLITGEVGVSAKLIYEAMAGTACGEMKDSDFQVQLSNHVREGKIVGFMGKKGPGGGYFPVGKVPAKKVVKEEVAEFANGVSLELGKGFMLTHSENNWTLKRPTGVDLHFGGKLNHALKRTSEVLLGANLGAISCDINSFVEAVGEAENRVLETLERVVSKVEPMSVSLGE